MTEKKKKRTEQKVDLDKRVKELEERLAHYESGKLTSKLYRGLAKQMNDIAELFNEIEVKTSDLRDKDDKFFERYFKYLEKIKPITEGLIELEKQVIPESDEQKEDYASPFEKVQSELKNK